MKGNLKWIAIVTGIALLVTWTVYRVTKNELVSQSKAVLNATMSGDADRIYDLMHHEERSAIAMSREEWRRFFNGYVAPKMSGLRAAGPLMSATDESGEQWGQAMQLISSPTGDQFTLSFRTGASEVQPISSITQDLIKFLIRMPIARETSNDDLKLLYKLRESYRAESVKMAHLGLAGVFDPTLRRMVTWEEIDKNRADAIEKASRYGTVKTK